ncbi:chemotaxis protein [Robbsia andropogonis]|uniref:protein-glutamate methylesterase n=1 Tax=Robbsia andropogonis TaxID=28092 RepID=A0A0F5JWF4_9BURK|nr:chemotaxis-specific protein-glutamate methyltransferase CheB [Robbsia andropogonis]KKB62183.1 chemotaxis protein [Robbsia andropogonis]MCP1119456.1 chemotaxis-specific protein-glutamate methyltransferase CheB [Robbsia andropogonis]MCP1129439.1 chemotaxis-specific protein-glutamate methyltransferase CheB [Robbsia andropogonis]
MKIGIVNDLDLAIQVLRRALALRPGYEVAWVAHNGAEAVELCAAERPDAVLMDLLMPVMDGVEATRRIMQASPCPILIVTSDIGAHVPLVYQAMGHGALDAVDTPSFAGNELAKTAAVLHNRLERIAQQSQMKQDSEPALSPTVLRSGTHSPLLIVGASAGGPAAMADLLSRLPVGFSIPVVLVQHVDVAFAPGMAEWLAQSAVMPVRIARNGEMPQPGTALLAGTNDHLRLDAAGTLRYSAEPAQSFYRPSVDALMGDVAAVWKGKAVGVVLSGMGRDGAIGLKAMRERGFYTVTQDKQSSAVYGMPKAAAEAHAAVDILPLSHIANAVASHF